MVIKAGKTLLLIRYNNYKKTDFIDEHNMVVGENGYTWMLKTGRKLMEKKLTKVIEESAILILKAPKGSGGGYYYTEIMDFYYGKQKYDNKFPEYYYELVEDENLWQVDSLDGTWIKIGQIKPLDKDIAENFRLVSNRKTVFDIVNSTMSSTLYVDYDKELIL